MQKKVTDSFGNFNKKRTFALAIKDGSVAQLDRATPF